MHVDDQTYTVKGRTYRRVLLRNSYRRKGKVCHDTVANLSKCSNEEIEAIKFALANKKNLAALKVPDKTVKTRQGLTIGTVWLLYQLAKRLGIVNALGRNGKAKLVLWMIISAVIGSVSRLSATRLAQSHAACDILGLDSFCEDDLYTAMDWLDDHQQVIEGRLFKGRYQHEKPNMYLYDVTSSYLEGNQNELGDYGYNRDGKKGKKQIVIGLLTDGEGRPISCEVFQGNTQDTKTFKSQVDKIAQRFGIKKVTFVGDRGMIKSAQISDLTTEKYHYITALTKPEIETLLKHDVVQMELFDKTICEVEAEGIRYIFRRNPIRVREIRETRQGKLRKMHDLCLQKSEYLAEHPRAKIKVAKRIVKEKAEKLKIDKWVNICNQGRNLSVEINKSALEEEEKLDGCYVIKTDLSVKTASKQTVHDRYKSLAEVEWAFRTMKTTLLHIRGVFVRKASRTRAHVFTIMLAYVIAYELRRLWQDIDATIEEGIEELSSLCATEAIIGNVSIQTVPEPRERGKLLLQKANITLPDAIPCRNVNVFTRKKLVEERRDPAKTNS
ncbi:MAG: IS1634 family transposase [Deltaproteobacteria bacterium]|nr:MAG: IS1634 family transposase [Deltaproteobacteria bacterium]